jgi:hypothetical protein
MSGRPLVVLAGWLGGKHRQLDRYEKLYQRLGFEVVSYIASPRLVVDHTFFRYPVQAPNKWPRLDSTAEEASNLQELAWHVLAQVSSRQPCGFIFHGFSNGGCFLWEQIRRIQMESDNKSSDNTAMDEETRAVLQSVMEQTKGVVFDSCPVWYYGTKPTALFAALHTCTWQEKLDVWKKLGPAYMFDSEGYKLRNNKRCLEFFELLRNDNLDIPQLYLYSKDDPLAGFQHIDKLSRYRQLNQKSPVLTKRWDSSLHVAHLFANGQEYTEMVEVFTANCLLRSKL